MKLFIRTKRENWSSKTEYCFAETAPDIDWKEAKYANNIMYSDVEPYEIIEVKGKKLILRSMLCKQTEKIPCQLGGFVGHFENNAQKWDIESDPHGIIKMASLRKDGRFRLVGSSSTKFAPSENPVKFYDYNF